MWWSTRLAHQPAHAWLIAHVSGVDCYRRDQPGSTTVPAAMDVGYTPGGTVSHRDTSAASGSARLTKCLCKGPGGAVAGPVGGNGRRPAGTAAATARGDGGGTFSADSLGFFCQPAGRWLATLTR